MSRSAAAPRLLVAALAATTLTPACVTPGEGLDPPLDTLYFPTGLALSPGRGQLYVANSDFDLAFNGGTVLVLDAEAIRGGVPRLWEEDGAAACASVGLGVNDNPVLVPGTCAPRPLGPLVRNSAIVGAFASDTLLVRRDGVVPRLLVPVRGDPSVTYFDVDDDLASPPTFRLDCGQGAPGGRCDAAHRVGENPEDNPRRLGLVPEPFGIAADEQGEAVLLTHQSDAAVSLLVNEPDRPRLLFAVGGLPPGPTGIAAVPRPAALAAASDTAYPPAFVATYRLAPQLDLFRYFSDEAAAPDRAFLARVGAFPVSLLSGGFDSRGVAVDAAERRACEASCPGADAGCLRGCAAIPLRIYVANRSPASLLVGRIETTLTEDGAFDTLELFESVPLSFGASRVVLGHVRDMTGAPRLRVFAITFDSRLIFSYDPEAHRIDGLIRTGRGPHAMAFDLHPSPDGHAYAYVAHFLDSYLGVVDLDQRHPSTYLTMVATVGIPIPPRESK